MVILLVTRGNDGLVAITHGATVTDTAVINAQMQPSSTTIDHGGYRAMLPPCKYR